jgi:predicted dehydrogenase
MQHNNHPIGIGVIGCGYWGVNYVRILNELPEARVITICDQREERLSEVAQRCPNAQWTTDLDALLGDPQIRAVVVCTEATSHFRVASQCLKAGKHVLIEKPITTVTSDAVELSRLAAERSLVLMVGHTFVYNGGISAVKSYLDQRTDKIYYLHASRTNLGPIRRDVNAIWDLATHDIAIFNYLLDGAPRWVSAVGGRVLGNCRVDVGFICLGYENGVIGHIHVSWADPNKCRETVVVCSERRLVFNDLNSAEPVRIYEKGVRALNEDLQSFGEFQLKIREGAIISPPVEPSEPLKNQCRHFLDCVDKGSKPKSSAEDGIDVLLTLEAIDRSIEMQGTRVKVERYEWFAQAS